MKQKIYNLLNYSELFRQLVIKDIKLKYRRSYLGYLWSILNPLLTMLVMIIVFSHFFKFDIPNFPVYLISGQIIFGFFAEATNGAVTSILDNSSLLKKIYVPKYIFTLSKVTSSLVNFLFSLVALILVVLITKASISWNVLYFPIVILQLYFFSLGISLILASTTVFFRDIKYLWSVIITLLMYLCPIFYPVTIIPEEYRSLYENLNPLVGYIQQFRNIVLYGKPPTFSLVALGFLIAVVSLIVGLWIFNRKQDKFILHL